MIHDTWSGCAWMLARVCYLMGGEYETGSRPLSVAEFRVAVVA